MSKVLFKDYMALQNVAGGKTWGDINNQGYLGSVKNTDFFNNLVASPTSIIGDNIVYEFGAYVSNEIFDNADLSANDPIVSKQVYQMPSNKLSFKYQILDEGPREAADWGKYLSETESKFNEQMMNVNQMTVYDGVIKYCLASGAVRVLPNLTNRTATKEQKLADLENLVSVCDAIINKQTIYNLGQDPNRVLNCLSPKAYRGAMFSFQALNNSDGAFNVAIKGEFVLFGGYTMKKVPQLGQAYTNIKSYDGKGYDFSKISAMTYSLDSLAVFSHDPVWGLVPNGLQSYVRSVSWKMLACPKPSMEHLNVIYTEKFPTIAEINATRAILLQEQPMAYAKIPGGALNQITQAEYAEMEKNSTNYDLIPLVNANDEIITRESTDKKGK